MAKCHRNGCSMHSMHHGHTPKIKMQPNIESKQSRNINAGCCYTKVIQRNKISNSFNEFDFSINWRKHWNKHQIDVKHKIWVKTWKFHFLNTSIHYYVIHVNFTVKKHRLEEIVWHCNSNTHDFMCPNVWANLTMQSDKRLLTLRCVWHGHGDEGNGECKRMCHS